MRGVVYGDNMDSNSAVVTSSPVKLQPFQLHRDKFRVLMHIRNKFGVVMRTSKRGVLALRFFLLCLTLSLFSTCRNIVNKEMSCHQSQQRNELSPKVSLLFVLKVCPICSHKITRDMLNHIRMQHGHLLRVQRHRRLRRVAITNSQALPFFGRDLREAHLQVLLGNGGFQSNNTSASNPATESLLSSLVLNFPSNEAEETQKCTITTVENLVTEKAAPSSQTWNSKMFNQPAVLTSH